MERKKNPKAEIVAGLEQFFPRLWRYCLALSGNRDRADDLAQNACLRAIEKAHLFEAGTRLDLWMFKLTQRVWLNEIRADAVRHYQTMMLIDDIEIPDNKPDPETSLVTRDCIMQVLNLPEAQRSAVILAYVEELSYRQVADILDIPIGTVMSRLANARVKLASANEESRRAG